ncbi:MAG: redoxin domain-containing protein [Gammaproteobacteria bacterium]|jgi:thiol-disulfide isomerase/thioredoxin/tetratricopeptide (TPR) repeat protein|nr:redoxin domain-containing protein [Gammaproteobacteria bacterium]
MRVGTVEERIMLARFVIPPLLLMSTAFADCVSEPVVVDAVLSVGDARCGQLPECLDTQLAVIERLLEARPDDILLHRTRQDLVLDAQPRQRDSLRDELINEYRHHPNLGAGARDYLVARLENNTEGLRAAAKQFPWAGMDLIRRQRELDGEALVEVAQAEQLLEGFVAECPDASVLVADKARELLASARWPVWTEVRRNLLDVDPPPWDRLGTVVIRAGLVEDGEGDPAKRLLAELESMTGDAHRETAGYWLYRARIHYQARDIDAALEANIRAREIDPCRQLPPLQRIRPEEAGEWRTRWMREVSREVLSCPPDFEVYQAWLIAAQQRPELIETEPLSRIRRAVDERALGIATRRLEQSLARIDICCADGDPGAAWATLDRLFETSMSRQDLERALGIDPASTAFRHLSRAVAHARLALDNDFPRRAQHWIERADSLFDEHQRTIEQSPLQAIPAVKAVESELEWIKARSEKRHADAVVHALSARAERVSWVDMEEVMASWRAAGGSESGFERLLKVWGLELPAEWRGWRRLGEPLPDFELSDMRGRVWTLEDVESKRTLVNLWAVWCGPCLLELPKVQALHERYRDDPDIQVLTINLDAVEGVARELMRREGYDFPVLINDGEDYPFDGVGIPRNWLVDGDGMRRWEQTGFTQANAEHWVEDIVSLIGLMQKGTARGR